MLNQSNQIENKLNILRQFSKLTGFRGLPTDFWPQFLEQSNKLTHSDISLLVVQEENNKGWGIIDIFPKSNSASEKLRYNLDYIENLANQTAGKGYYWENNGQLKDLPFAMGARLMIHDEKRQAVALFLLKNAKNNLDRMISQLGLIIYHPLIFQLRQENLTAERRVSRFASSLDLLTVMSFQKRFLAAAMALCNELSSRFQCSRVSLGWIKNKYIRIQAISHLDQFEKKMAAIQSLEASMEETFDQDEEIIIPQPSQNTSVVRAHLGYSRENGSNNIISLPVRYDDEPVGVLTCERESNPFTENEIYDLRLNCDIVTPRLGDLKKHDKWFGAKIVDYIQDKIGLILGFEHTFAKSIAIVICMLLGVLVFGKWQYRVEAPFIVKTDDLASLTAAFDGYIDEVNKRIGDQVKKNEVLLKLNSKELLLQESSAIADQSRYLRETEKARAKNALADMKIAESLYQQATANLEIIRYHLKNARIVAPFDGVVVEGEFDELLGAPVRQGDTLFKIAKLGYLYVELELSEKDIHEISNGNSGEIMFISQPDMTFPIQVARFDPVAVNSEEGNIFKVRCILSEKTESWWRPGMSGIAKINVGERRLLWIATHRTVDFLRMFFWF